VERKGQRDNPRQKQNPVEFGKGEEEIYAFGKKRGVWAVKTEC